MDLTIEAIEKELHNLLYYDDLPRYSSTPLFDRNKLNFLFHLITAIEELKTVEKKNYILASMLTHVALDTHDMILNEQDGVKIDEVNQQLTVLAGDYYSGLYYQLLARINDIPIIQTLAEAIKEINEIKMDMYYDDHQSLSSFFIRLKTIESNIITSVADHVCSYDISELAKRWLLINKLTQVKFQLTLEKNTTPLIQSLYKVSQVTCHRQLIKIINGTIDENWRVTKALLKNLPVQFNALQKNIEVLYADNAQSRLHKEI